MSYTIPDLERQFAQLSDADRNKGFARLFPYYDNVRKFNGSSQVSQFLSDPNLNKILEYCSYNHDQSNIPNNLQNLKDDVTSFFGSLFSSVEDEKMRKNLFTHFLMRECNKKTIPISDTAIANIYLAVFGEEIKPKIITMVSNYCGLYYTLKSPYEYLVDTDNFDAIFGEEDSGETEDEVELEDDETDTMEETVYEHPFYTFLNPDGMEKAIPATKLKKIILFIAHKSFRQKPFSTTDIVTALCEDYEIDENIWGQYLNYNKSTLREKISSAMYQLRTDKFLKKSANRTNTVTPKGSRKVKEYIKKYGETQMRVFLGKPLTFDEDKVEEVKSIAYSIENTWDKSNNYLSQIVLQSHYEINAERSQKWALEIPFGLLSDYICQQYGIDENIWGQYLNQKRTMFKKQVSSFKGRLTKKGFLEKTDTSASIITQAGIDLVESWCSTCVDVGGILDPLSTSYDPEIADLVGNSNPNETDLLGDIETTPMVEDKVVEEDFSDEKTFTVEQEEIVETTTLSVVTDTLEEDMDDNYDDYLRQVLSDNDTLSEQVKDLKSTVDTFVSFLKEKDLLSEYIVSISKSTTIPF